ncbi:MAG TPA: homogentisate phytyltransferase [Saprospiraceae bacterium]|nr:homogentisate phytyltransferase [Saprospiraceae bacterium]HPI05739.1 homogentisate phytyltransferase [Saprospiraceae bacterium]
MIRNFIRFSRLHTVIGTTLSISALYVIALSFSDGRDTWFATYCLTLLACLGANIYIVGLNQITDVEIDRINKPWLPLASGAYTMRTARTIIGVSILLALVIAAWTGKYLLLTVLLSLALGTAYSLPPLRLKRFHFWAAFCIIAVRGVIVNILLFLHFHSIINGSTQIPPVIAMLTVSIFVYSIAIAWFKDVPDMEGDRRFQIRTLTLQLGARNVLSIGNTLLALLFVANIALAWTGMLGVNKWVFAIGHLLMLAALGGAVSRLKLEEPDSVRRYYLFIWILFFAEYVVFAAGAYYSTMI